MFPPSLRYLCGLAILEGDAIKTDLGDCTGFDSGHFLGHEPDLVEVYEG
jgi:hypothetical protein